MNPKCPCEKAKWVATEAFLNDEEMFRKLTGICPVCWQMADHIENCDCANVITGAFANAEIRARELEEAMLAIASSMGREFTIELGWIPPAVLRGNMRGSYRGREEARTEMKDAGLCNGMELNLPTSLGECEVTFVLFHNRRALDLDNMLIGYKYWMDGMVKSGVFRDDNANHVSALTIRWGDKVKKGQSHTQVKIEEL